MAYSAPPTQATNDIIGATQWNRLVNNDLWFGAGSSASGKPNCYAQRTSVLTVATATPVAMPFLTNVLDNAGCHSTSVNPSRFTAPVAGWYWCMGGVDWSSNATGARIEYLTANGGAAVSTDSRTSPGPSSSQTHAVIFLAIGQYVEFVVSHSAGTNLDATGWFWFEYIAVT